MDNAFSVENSHSAAMSSVRYTKIMTSTIYTDTSI